MCPKRAQSSQCGTTVGCIRSYVQSISRHYLSEDVRRHTSGHEDGAQLLQQATLVHGLLTAGCRSRRVHWRHHDSHQLSTEHFVRFEHDTIPQFCSLSLWVELKRRYLQHEVEVGDLLRRPTRVVIPDFKPGLHPLNVRALLEKVLVGAVVFQQVEQQQQAVLHHDTCATEQKCFRIINLSLQPVIVHQCLETVLCGV